ncbi:MAG: hypothetical protein HOA49_04395 [Flavobacteriales bacterium]|nr:hypothetical protein [Flavobacteriales bacterium]
MKNNSYKNTHSFVNITFLFLISLFFISSCDKEENIQEVPSYIHIEDLILTTNSSEGANTHNITDVWVYVESDSEIEFRGTYPLPATIPLLKTDSTKIYIRAGIKDNGIAGTRVRYSFYKTFETDVFLVKDSIVNINPNFEYVSNANFEIENFEGVGTNIDTTIKSDIDFEIETEGGNKYAHAILDDDNLIFEVATEEFENLPQVGAPVYIELDYKSNHDFMVGAYINYPFSVVNRELLWVTPKEDWNKIYINMTGTVSEAIDNTSLKFYINMFRTDTTQDAWIEFDNFKLVY